MCGISGIFGHTDAEAAKASVQKMNMAMAHRGPDADGVFANDSIALGHRRLSIIDLSAAGNQPFFSSDRRFAIVFNGEIYNFLEIRNLLEKEFTFHTKTDTEVLLYAYLKWGRSFLDRLNGMFAFAIWDDLKKELFIARDRLGIKPLYYFRKNGVLVFASEIRAILNSGMIPKKLNRESLICYIQYQTIHAPETIISDVKMLLPGQFMVLSGSELNIGSYWNINKLRENNNSENYQSVCSNVHDLLLKAVERRLIADVPFGAFLSGGIDSSIVVGLMAKVSEGKVKTFSVTFEEQDFNEGKFAATVAKKFGTDHHEIRLKVSDFLDKLPQALLAMDHPGGDGPNSYVVSEATKKAGITMALSGLGGDELFAGYDIFQRSLNIQKNEWLNMVPKTVRRISGAVLTKVRPGVASNKLKSFLELQRLDVKTYYPLSRQVLKDDLAFSLLSEKNHDENPVSEIISEIPYSRNRVLSWISRAEMTTYMQNVLLRDADQMSMAHALEVRVPFLDYTLVEYVMSLPDKYKIPSTPKKLLVDSFRGLLPEDVINRKKMGFTFPWKHWMKNELRQFCASRIRSLSQRPEFNGEALNNLWEGFLNDDPGITWSRVWHLVVLENWLNENGIHD